MKMTEKKFNEFKIVNINDFRIDLNKLMNQFAAGDEYPQMRQTISNTNTIQIIVTVSFFKYYSGSGEYTIKAEEFKKSNTSNYMMGGTGCFNKTYYELKTDNNIRFSLKKIKELCSNFNMKELKATILNDYAGCKGYNVNEINMEMVAL